MTGNDWITAVVEGAIFVACIVGLVWAVVIWGVILGGA